MHEPLPVSPSQLHRRQPRGPSAAGSNINVLMIWPRFPSSFWGFEGVLEMLPEAAMTPPLGLITVAALCPPSGRSASWTNASRKSATKISLGRPGHGQRHARAALPTRATSCCAPAPSDAAPSSAALGQQPIPKCVLEYADHVMVGEAEEAFAAIADGLEAGNRASVSTASSRSRT